MKLDRRSLLLALAGPSTLAACTHTIIQPEGASPMYGLIGKMKASAGKRDELTSILLTGLRDMPGNLS